MDKQNQFLKKMLDAGQEKSFLEVVAINKSGALKSGLAWRHKFWRAHCHLW